MLVGPLALELGHQVAEPGELVAHGRHLLGDDLVARLEVLVGRRHPAVEPLAGHGEHQIDDLLRGRRLDGPGGSPRSAGHDDDQGGTQPDDGAGQHHEDDEEIHATTLRRGCDNQPASGTCQRW